MRICGTGCSLMDYLYASVRFDAEPFRRHMSRSEGDGGLRPGGLVFTGDLERFAGRPFEAVLGDLTEGRTPDAVNLGGPAIVALIHAAQLLVGRGVKVRFFGGRGADQTGMRIMDHLRDKPVDCSGYAVVEGSTPVTYVFSDPGYAGGHGERMFVNDLGAAGGFTADRLPQGFFGTDIALFGGTALVPPIHGSLTALLRRAREAGAMTVVTTVYDFLSERSAPGLRWPMGDGDAAFPLIDLLITDREEALRLSGKRDVEEAAGFFRAKGVGAFVATQGPDPVLFTSRGRLFSAVERGSLPAAEEIDRDLAAHPEHRGDTTGCGDNFAGGVVASLAAQLAACGPGDLSLAEACAWGVVSGGFACTYVGGTYREASPGEKRRLIGETLRVYTRRLGLEPLRASWD